MNNPACENCDNISKYIYDCPECEVVHIECDRCHKLSQSDLREQANDIIYISLIEYNLTRIVK